MYYPGDSGCNISQSLPTGLTELTSIIGETVAVLYMLHKHNIWTLHIPEDMIC